MSVSNNSPAAKYEKHCSDCGDERELMIATPINSNTTGAWVRCSCDAINWAQKTTQ